MRHAKSYVKGHPNPQCYRANYTSLIGKWDFTFDDSDLGLKENYQNSFLKKSKVIVVPYSYQSEKSGIGENSDHDILRYHKSLEISELSDVEKLIFLGVDYETTLFINGVLVGNHTGGYDSFSFDIRNFLHVGKNDVTLRVVDKKHIDQIRGKQTWRKGTFECFYTPTSGIWKDVYLEHLNKAHIASFRFISEFEEGRLSLDISTVDCRDLNLTIDIEEEDKHVASQSVKISKDRMLISIDIADPLPRSPSDPKIYDVTLSINSNGTIVDQILTYFGFNDCSSRKEELLLNGENTYLKLVLDQGYYPGGFYTGDEDQFIFDIETMKEMGFNGCRKHEKIETPLFYYYCDILGFYLWQEVPSSHRYSLEYSKELFLEIPRQIEDHYNHPSIIAYVIFNESRGVNEIANNDEEILLSLKLYDLVKDLVRDRFVISNDGWEHTASDLLTMHNYNETYDKLFHLYLDSIQKIKNGENALINDDKYAYAKGFSYKEQPILLTEFGGIAFDKDKSTGRGYGNSVKSEAEYVSKLRSQMLAIKDIKEIRGYCLTQLSDVEIEKNGLLTFERKLKIDPEGITKLNAMFE
jgi:beta-galactosidase/beta-glucuronidase